MSVPPIPRPPAPPTQLWRSVFGENFFYILYFQEPGPADAELGGDPARTMRRMIGGLRPADGNAILSMASPGPEGFIDRLPNPTDYPTGSVRTRSTTTSRSSAGRVSPEG